MHIEPIGFLRTCFGSKFAVPRQSGLSPSAWGVLEFCEDYRNAEAVRGLEGFSHIWLIFGFHVHEGKKWQSTVRPPRLGGNERVGVFASRSTYRPNGLGLSVVRLERVCLEREGDMMPPMLYVSGVDLVDGTPIYDIKPYLPYADSVVGGIGGYADEEPARLRVEIDDCVKDGFAELDERTRQVILEVLSMDSRPAASPKGDGRVYGALLCGKDVRFQVEDGICRLVEIVDLKSQL